MSTILDTYRAHCRRAAAFAEPELLDPWDIAEIADEEDTPGFLKDGVTILAGTASSGKTSFATALALAYAAGEPFAEQPIRAKMPVAWFAAEEDSLDRARLLAHRYKTPTEQEPELQFETHYGAHPLDVHDNLARFVNSLPKTGCSLAVLDPLPAFLTNKAAYRDLILTLRQIGLDYGVCFLVTLWTGVAGVIGGPSVASAANALWRLEPGGWGGPPQCALEQDRPQPRLLRLNVSGRAYPAPQTLLFKSRNPLHYELTDQQESPPPEPKRKSTEDALLQALSNEPKTACQLADELHTNIKTIRNALTKLTTSNQAQAIKHQGKTTYTN